MRRCFSIFMSFLVFNVIYPMPLDVATFSVGERFFSQAQYKEAEQRFLDIVRKFPDSEHYTKSLFYLGQIYGYLGKYKPALQYYKILLKKSSSLSEKQSSLLGIAKSWMQLGVYNKSAEFYAFFASTYPESEHAAAALYFSGVAREREGKVDHAIEKYRSVLNLYPQSDHYAKSIEKLALLDHVTPESLWEDNCVKTVPVSPEKEELFPCDNYEINKSLCASKDTQRSSLVSDELSVQSLEIKEPLSSEIKYQDNTEQSSTKADVSKSTSRESEFKDYSAVQIMNNSLVPSNNANTLNQKYQYEIYKNQWNEEQKLEKKKESILNAESSIEDIVTLTHNKSQILDIKENSLRQAYGEIRDQFYEDFKDVLQDTNEEEADDGLVCLPEDALLPQGDLIVQEELQAVLSSKKKTSKKDKNRSIKRQRCKDFELSQGCTYILDTFDQDELEDEGYGYEIN